MSASHTPTYAEIASHCYPLGNTPAICLTQDALPDEDVTILLLGCGDARHVLYTAFADNKFGRKLDFTCCDNQTMVIARNVMLYTLLLDDKDGSNHIRIWNAYYHVRIDYETLRLIHLQAKKLHQFASSIENWAGGKYGKVIRFCDKTTLELIRGSWTSMMLLDHDESDLKNYESEFRDFRTVSNHWGGTERQKRVKTMLNMSRSIGPSSFLFLKGLSLLSSQYWFYGSADEDELTLTTLSHSNPMFAFFITGSGQMNITSTPFSGFHLGAHLISLSEESPLGPESAGHNPTSHGYKNVIGTMRRQFQAWSMAFRNRVSEGLILRFFSGDAVAFCNTLEYKGRNKKALSANVYRNTYGFEPLALDSKDYTYTGQYPRPAPLLFDVIDTSNLVDHIGGINVLVAASPLLRKSMSSTIYTETIARQASCYKELINDLVCGDLPSIGALLRLFPVEYYANASAISTIDEATVIMTAEEEGLSSHGVMYSRLAWKRQLTGDDRIHFKHTDMVRLLEHTHNEMFRGEVPTRLFSDKTHETKRAHIAPVYTRASFAALLRWVQQTTVVDWEAVIPDLKKALVGGPLRPLNIAFQDEFNVQMHNFGVYSVIMDPNEIRNSIQSKNSSGFKAWEGVPPVMCVTMEVPRYRMDAFTELFKGEPLSIPFQCLLKSGDRTQQNYSALQMSFGEISTTGQRNTADFELFIAEDDESWDGDAPLLVSFYISTSFALEDPDLTKVSLVIQHTMQTYTIFKEALGIEKTLYETNLGNEKSVYITVLPPGQLERPALLPASRKAPDRNAALALSATLDPALPKIVTYRRTIESTNDSERRFFWSGSGVDRRQLSLCSMTFNTSPFDPRRYLDHCHNLRFPAPVTSRKKDFKLYRSQVRVEMNVSIEKYSNGDGPSRFMYPLFLRHEKPVLMNMPYLDLNQLPKVKQNVKDRVEWLEPHMKFQFSSTERASLTLPTTLACKDARACFKRTLQDMFMEFSSLDLKVKPAHFRLVSRKTGREFFTIFVSAMLLDVANRTIVLDAAVLRATKEANEQYSKISSHAGPIILKIDRHERQLWHYAFPAWVERCREWHHVEACEYKATKMIPLGARIRRYPLTVSPFCSCGNGVLPPDFVKNVPGWDTIAKYAVRAAISPCFAVDYVDPVYLPGDSRPNTIYLDPRCLKCKSFKAEGGSPLFSCPKCSKAMYCSNKCRKLDWPTHRLECKKDGDPDTKKK